MESRSVFKPKLQPIFFSSIESPSCAVELGRAVGGEVQLQPPLGGAGSLADVTSVLVREVDDVGVPPLGGVVAEDLVAVVALEVERLLLVHHLDVVLKGALLAEPLPAVVAHEALAMHRLVVPGKRLL